MTATGTIPADRELGCTQIKKLLKHRHPMIFLDRVLDYQPGERLRGLLNVSSGMDCIAGHFPERSIFPSSNLIQAIAQGGIILFQLSTTPLADDELTLMGTMQLRSLKVIVPGDQVILDLTCKTLRGDFLGFSARASVDGKPVAAGQASLIRRKVAHLGRQLW